MTTTDKRIIKSKIALKDALLTIMKEKQFKNISIKEIVEIAKVNRGTFYKHYVYKEDILEEIIDDVISDLTDSFRDPYKGNKVFEVTKLTPSAIKVFDHVYKYANFYTLIIQSNILVGFQNRICDELKNLALTELIAENPNEKINSEIQASFYAYAILGMIVEWVNGGFKFSSNYMAEQLLEIIKNQRTYSILKANIPDTE